MKRIFIVGLTIIIGYLLQVTLFQTLQLAQVGPNLLLIVTVSFALIRGKLEGAFIGFFCGLMIDIFFGQVVGFYTLIYMYIGYINGFVYQSFFRESLLIPTLMVAISNFFYSLIVYLVTFLLRGKLDFSFYLYRIIIPEIIYTTLLSLVVYRLILYINSKIEAHEKGVQ